MWAAWYPLALIINAGVFSALFGDSTRSAPTPNPTAPAPQKPGSNPEPPETSVAIAPESKVPMALVLEDGRVLEVTSLESDGDAISYCVASGQLESIDRFLVNEYDSMDLCKALAELDQECRSWKRPAKAWLALYDELPQELQPHYRKIASREYPQCFKERASPSELTPGPAEYPTPTWEQIEAAQEEHRRRQDALAALPPTPKPSKYESKRVTYHGNTETRVFHSPYCRYYNCSACTRVFSSAEAARRAGYRPCDVCQ